MFYKVYTRNKFKKKKKNGGEKKGYVQVPEPNPYRSQRGKGMFPLGPWESRSSVSGPTRSEPLAKKSALSYI